MGTKELKLTALVVSLFYPTLCRLVIGYEVNFPLEESYSRCYGTNEQNPYRDLKEGLSLCL